MAIPWGNYPNRLVWEGTSSRRVKINKMYALIRGLAICPRDLGWV